jgi:hypothetical protein
VIVAVCAAATEELSINKHTSDMLEIAFEKWPVARKTKFKVKNLISIAGLKNYS